MGFWVYNHCMIITCPACYSQYVLPDKAIGPKGRRVKCTSCNYTWLEHPQQEITASFIPHEKDDFTAAPRKRVTPVVKEKLAVLSILKVGTGIAIALLLITFSFAVGMRKDIVARMPTTALLFEKVGLPVKAPGKGLTFSEVTAQVDTAAEHKNTLAISGKLSNDTKQLVLLQRLIIRMNGENGWLKDWPVNLYGQVLEAGTANEFHYDLKDIPENGRSVTLLFTD
jgi:predicted Zn finger-like uncharacterized protein